MLRRQKASTPVNSSGFTTEIQNAIANSVLYDHNANFAGYNERLIIPSSQLNKSYYGSGFASLNLMLRNSKGTLDGMYIGHANTSASAYAFDGNQVQVTFNGATSLTISSFVNIISDPVRFLYNPQKSLIVSSHWGGSSIVACANPLPGFTGASRYLLGASQVGVTAPTGSWSTDNYWNFITYISLRAQPIPLQFGNISSTAGGDGGHDDGQKQGGMMTLATGGILQSLSVQLSNVAGNTALGIYDDLGTGGGPGGTHGPKNLLTSTPQFVADIVGWNTRSVSSNIYLSPGNYWILYDCDDFNQQITYGTDGITYLYDVAETSGGNPFLPFPNPWVGTLFFTTAGYGLYATVAL